MVWAVKVSVFGLARWPPAGAPIVTVQLVPAAPTLNGIVCDCPASIMIPPEFDEHPLPETLYMTIKGSAGPPERVIVAELEVDGESA